MRRLWHFNHSPLKVWGRLPHSLIFHLILVLQSVKSVEPILIIIELLKVLHLILHNLPWTIVACGDLLKGIYLRLSPCLILLRSDVSWKLGVSNHVLLSHATKNFSPGRRLWIWVDHASPLELLLSNIHLLLSQELLLSLLLSPLNKRFLRPIRCWSLRVLVAKAWKLLGWTLRWVALIGILLYHIL